MANPRKLILAEIIKNRPDAMLVANKYKVIAKMVQEMFPQHFENITQRELSDVLYEAINGDRDWRMLVEGHEDKKDIEEKWLINNGYTN